MKKLLIFKFNNFKSKSKILFEIDSKKFKHEQFFIYIFSIFTTEKNKHKKLLFIKFIILIFKI